MSRGKKGQILIIIAAVVIIILIIACLLGIICPPPPPGEEIVATAFLSPPNGLEIPKEPYFGLIPGDFTPDEKVIMLNIIPRVSEAVTCLFTEGVQAAMNKYN